MHTYYRLKCFLIPAWFIFVVSICSFCIKQSLALLTKQKVAVSYIFYKNQIQLRLKYVETLGQESLLTFNSHAQPVLSIKYFFSNSNLPWGKLLLSCVPRMNTFDNLFGIFCLFIPIKPVHRSKKL